MPPIKLKAFLKLYQEYYKAVFTVLMILAAILYGSPFDAGLLSSNHPLYPF